MTRDYPTIHTIPSTDYGPTDHAGGNSAANRWSTAESAVRSIASECQAGDSIDESIYDCDDMTVDCLYQALAERGLSLGDGDCDGRPIVHAG
jgi:hypothetical protein